MEFSKLFSMSWSFRKRLLFYGSIWRPLLRAVVKPCLGLFSSSSLVTRLHHWLRCSLQNAQGGFCNALAHRSLGTLSSCPTQWTGVFNACSTALRWSRLHTICCRKLLYTAIACSDGICGAPLPSIVQRVPIGCGELGQVMPNEHHKSMSASTFHALFHR